LFCHPPFPPKLTMSNMIKWVWQFCHIRNVIYTWPLPCTCGGITHHLIINYSHIHCHNSSNVNPTWQIWLIKVIVSNIIYAKCIFEDQGGAGGGGGIEIYS
jgi:hypothetical protein